MRRGWKRLAERAANAAFDDNERRDALAGALQGDWRDEVAEDLVGRLLVCERRVDVVEEGRSAREGRICPPAAVAGECGRRRQAGLPPEPAART